MSSSASAVGLGAGPRSEGGAAPSPGGPWAEEEAPDEADAIERPQSQAHTTASSVAASRITAVVANPKMALAYTGTPAGPYLLCPGGEHPLGFYDSSLLDRRRRGERTLPIHALNKTVERLVLERPRAEDLLGLLLDARREDPAFTTLHIRNEIVTVLIAGHEPVASGPT